MNRNDPTDLIGGLVLIAVSLFVVIYSQRWDFGTIAHMGPSFFPTVLGAVLGLLGAVMVGNWWLAPPDADAPPAPRLSDIAWRPAICILVSVTLFALLLRPLGLVAASALTVLIATLGENEITWTLRLILAVAVTAVTVGIFKLALGMTVPLWW